MLKSLKIYNYRSCVDTAIDDIGAMLVLIGRNGAGKSNILKAIEWVASSTYKRPSELVLFTGTLQFPNVEVDFTLGDRILRYRAGVEWFPQQKSATFRVNQFLSEVLPNGHVRQIFALENGELATSRSSVPVSVGPEANAFTSIPSLFPDFSEAYTLEFANKFLARVKYYPLDTPSQGALIVSKAQYDGWLGGKRELEIPEVIFQLIYLKNQRPEKFYELIQLLGENGLNIITNIDIQEVSSHPEGAPSPATEFFVPHFVPVAAPSKLFNFRDLSHGTRRTTSLLTAMMFDEANVSLIEQPEDGIHAALLNKLFPLLRRYSEHGQYFVATHSALVLNAVLPSELRFISMANAVTQAHALSADHLNVAVDYLEQEGPLADFVWMMEGD